MSPELIQERARVRSRLIKLFDELDRDVAMKISDRKFSAGTALAVMDMLREEIAEIEPGIREHLSFSLSEKAALETIKRYPQGGA